MNQSSTTKEFKILSIYPQKELNSSDTSESFSYQRNENKNDTIRNSLARREKYSQMENKEAKNRER